MLPSLSLPTASSMFFTRAAALVYCFLTPSPPGLRLWSSHSLFPPGLWLWFPHALSPFPIRAPALVYSLPFSVRAPALASSLTFSIWFPHFVSLQDLRPWSPDPGPYPALLRSSIAVSFRLWLACFFSLSLALPPSLVSLSVFACLYQGSSSGLIVLPPFPPYVGQSSGFCLALFCLCQGVTLCFPPCLYQPLPPCFLPGLTLWCPYPSLPPCLPGLWLWFPHALSPFPIRAPALVSSLPFFYQGSGFGFFTSFLYLVSSLPVSLSRSLSSTASFLHRC